MNIVFDAITFALTQKAQSLHQGKRGTCSVGCCPNNAIAKGLCNAHYLRTQHGKSLLPPVKGLHTIRCVECNEIVNSKGGWGLCAKHYKSERIKVIKAAAVKSMGDKCSACNISYPLSVYDFHHKNNKDHSAAYLISNRNIATIAEELEKCALLCANCHRIEHHGH